MADLSGVLIMRANLLAWKIPLNDTSIGIEIVQEVNCNQREEGVFRFPPQVCVYPDFSPKLVNNILKALDKIYHYYPDIKAVDVIASGYRTTEKARPWAKVSLAVSESTGLRRMV